VKIFHQKTGFSSSNSRKIGRKIHFFKNKPTQQSPPDALNAKLTSLPKFSVKVAKNFAQFRKTIQTIFRKRIFGGEKVLRDTERPVFTSLPKSFRQRSGLL